MADKLKNLCSDFSEAREKYTVCDSCGALYLKTRPTCPNCGMITTKELQPGDMEREVNQ